MIMSHPQNAKGRNTPTELTLSNTESKCISSTKSQGVMVGENLNWDEQFKTVKSKFCGGTASLEKLKKYSPPV